MAVALLSGGLDSAVAVALWLEGGRRVALCLTFDYGQRSAVGECRAAAALAGRFGAPWRAVPLPWLAEAAAASALVDPQARLPGGTPASPGDAASAAAVWVPARNLVLLAAAAAIAEGMGETAVLAGFNREEAATFPDNSRAFLEAANRTLALGTRTGVAVASPTLDLDKPAIARHARRSGFSPGDFWSCYAGGELPCERCESCLRSARAWATAT